MAVIHDAVTREYGSSKGHTGDATAVSKRCRRRSR